MSVGEEIQIPVTADEWAFYYRLENLHAHDLLAIAEEALAKVICDPWHGSQIAYYAESDLRDARNLRQRWVRPDEPKAVRP